MSITKMCVPKSISMVKILDEPRNKSDEELIYYISLLVQNYVCILVYKLNKLYYGQNCDLKISSLSSYLITRGPSHQCSRVMSYNKGKPRQCLEPNV